MGNWMNLYAVREEQGRYLDSRRPRLGRRVSKRNRFQASLEGLERREVPTTFTVNSLGDNNAGSGDTGDLRYVINRANSLHTGTAATPDLITFSGVSLTQAAHTIHVGAGAAGPRPLPALTDVAIIDGTTANGFNNLSGLLLTLDGRRLRGHADGLTLAGGSATVRGLEIVNFPGNGIRVNSSGNTIGGNEVGVNANGQRNNPAGRITSPLPPTTTTPVFVRPPQGNVISGNGGDGVLIANGANANLLEGNFIGTDVTGLHAVGNRGNGVTIVNSDSNEVLGTTPPDQDNPFVFYNVISGNRGNGLVIDNSTNTTVYANFFGLAADNQTPLGNRRDGVLIKGASDLTKFGANIPLGNVTSANGGNGVEVTGSASRTILANTFSGVAAFNPSARVGNRGDGILINANGGVNVFGSSRFSTIILTCQTAGNNGNGIEIGGRSSGVQVSQTVIGMQTNGMTPQPNRQNGILIRAGASQIAVGGFEPSVAGVPENGSFLEAANLISGNLQSGVAINGNVRGLSIVNSFIGTDITGNAPAGNGRYGILVSGSSETQIGSRLGVPNPRDRNLIAFNALDGVLVRTGTGNGILGNSIFSNGRLGIALQASGNRKQPSPVLTSAQVESDGTTEVTGTLAARPNTAYQIEIFASPSDRPGNGQIFLGVARVATDPDGLAQFTIGGLANPDPAGADFVTATATGPMTNTSMFSLPIRASQNG